MKNLPLLLVEDNEGDIVLAKEALASVQTGIFFNVVGEGREALFYLKNQSKQPNALLPRAILLDINLPGMNGKEFLSIIKVDSILSKIPIVVFSSTTSEKEIREVYLLGADWYATKPDRNEDYVKLIQKIEDILNKGIVCKSFEEFTIS